MIKNGLNGAIAEWIGRWSAAQTWLVILAASTMLHFIDAAFPTVGMGPLYIPVIALATWRLGPRWGTLVMVAAVALNAMTMARTGEAGETGIFLARGVIRISAYLCVIGIVTMTRGAYRNVRELARRDVMTGAANRMAFEDRLEQFLAPADRRRRNFLITHLDLDDFKAVNDCHGHAAGDAVLRGFAEQASLLLGGGDCFARLGGDEFALVVGLKDGDDGEAVARQLHDRLRRAAARLPSPIGFSMGALIVPASAALDRDALLQAADQLMYAVKRAGKGSVRIEMVETKIARRALGTSSRLITAEPESGRPTRREHARS